jgi:hypothetical protein
MNFLRSLFGRTPSPEPFGRVQIDDAKIVYHRPDKKEEEIKWRDLIEVGIVTTDEGPLQEDVYFMMLGPSLDRGCSIPQGAVGTDVLVSKLQGLPDFDNSELIKAMGCTSNNSFTCWRKK